MKLRISLHILLLLLLSAFTLPGPKLAYRIINLKGKDSNYEKLLADASKADIVLFGELHNNPISHWLELELAKDLFAKKGKNLILGAEMFEADNQLQVDSFLDSTLVSPLFGKRCRLWSNYQTDYAPLLEFAQSNHLRFIASNVPRRYAKLVNKGGFEALDTLSAREKSWICPLPVPYDSNLTCYKDIRKLMGGHGGPNIGKAQAIKDATMAYFILSAYQKGKLVLHYNGAGHSNHYQNIYWYLKMANPALNIVTISTTELADIYKVDEDNKHLADFTILVPEAMTKTY